MFKVCTNLVVIISGAQKKRQLIHYNNLYVLNGSTHSLQVPILREIILLITVNQPRRQVIFFSVLVCFIFHLI